MTPLIKWSVTLLLIITVNIFTAQGQDSTLIFISRTGTLPSRVFCSEVLQCVGTGTDVFWTFFGLGATRVPDSDTRFTNTSQMVVNGSTVITANLTFAPLSTSHATIYVCQVSGPTPASTNIRVTVEAAPVVLLSDIQNIDLSQYTVGDSITVTCQVETCLSDVTTTFYKGSQVLQTTTVTNSNMKVLTFAYNIIVAEDSAGEYACRALTSQGGTPNDLFTLSGTPKASSTSVTPSSTSTTTSATSTTSTITSSTTLSNTASVVASTSSSETMMSATPVPVSPSPGGGSIILIEWSLMLTLLIITLISSIVVW